MNDVKKVIGNVDKGFYAEAQQKGTTALAALTQLVAPEPPQYAELAEKAWRRGPMGRMPIDKGSPYWTACENYAYDLAGLNECMKAAGIRRSDTVEKAFFSSSNASGTQGLFPAFLASQIIAGQMATSLVPMICLSEVRINSHVQEKVKITDTTATRQLNWIDEGQDIPKTTISKSTGSITLHKYGRMLEATYETVRLLHLDIISLQLQRMGRQVGIDETDTLLETAVTGDGNSSSSGTSANTAVSGTLAYTDLVTHWQTFAIGYEQRHSVAPDALIANLVNMAEFKDHLQGFDFLRTGAIPGPFGSTWHRWTSTGSAGYGTTKVVSFDDRVAMVMYREGDLLEEADQLIDKQLHRRSMTEWVGFMTWDTAGIQILDRQT
jgi:hypothetical protein